MNKVLLWRLCRREWRCAWPSLFLLLGAAGIASAQTVQTANDRKLPIRTSRYNPGGFPGRYRDANGKGMRFELKHEASVFDGGGREMGRTNQPVLLNSGAVKEMAAGGQAKETYVWVWRSEAGSGWIARSVLKNPPPTLFDANRNPKPPREANTPLTIDASSGTRKLKGLRHVSSNGEIPPGHGNQGGHYAGRKPGPQDFIYLLFAVPNVQRGGTAKDSIPDGGRFIPALDEQGHPIQEEMTMYRNSDLKQPVPVTFIYGRVPGSDSYGWIARANVGEP